MLQAIYKLLIEPRAENPDQRNRELVLNWLLFGVVCLVATYALICFSALIFLHEPKMLIQFLVMDVIIGVIFWYSIFFRAKERYQTIASILLATLLFLAAIFIVYTWGIVNPYGILLFGLVIVVVGILLGARYSLYAAVATAFTLAFFEYARNRDIVTPDISWVSSPSTMADVINLSAMFVVIALVCWLFNRQMEDSLQRARRSEQALKEERDMLEIKVKERTRALQEAQLEKVQQVYRFAELGHLSTALFHDLAGSLASLSIDIESLRNEGQTDFTKRIDSNIRYIDGVVQRVKSQIQGKDNIETFDILAEVKDLVGILSYNARKARTSLQLEVSNGKPIIFTGNLTRFRQLIINLLSNAIEAYPPAPKSAVVSRPVIIKLSETAESTVIQVTDHGQGIKKINRNKIFDPFYTTKASGSGIGLFIVSQVAEKDFGGKIDLRSSKKTGTTFTVTLPKKT